ncbi:MAG: phosphoserine phosphatase SerB [Deltaproteobacteria bacterium]|nr:phosphoserine phosphatase SerB [Deltaproteobacteria bacterium]
MLQPMNKSVKNARVLVTVRGEDTPGITASLTGIVALTSARLLDVEQVVVHGQLTLCLLLELNGEGPTSVLKDLLFAAKGLNMELDFKLLDAPGSDELYEELKRYAITAIGAKIGAQVIHDVTTLLAKHKANIDKIHRLSNGDLRSVEIEISFWPQDSTEQNPEAEYERNVVERLRRELVAYASPEHIDIAVQKNNLLRRQKRLVVMDMDSTLIKVEIIDELARIHGVYDEVAKVTEQAMQGDMEFDDSLRMRVKLLKGLPFSKAKELADDLPVSEGAEQLLQVLKRLGFKTAVLSGGFTFAAEALKSRLGLDYAYANDLEVQNGVFTGNVVGPIVGPQRKADLLDVIAQQEGILLEQTIAVGDGANDMLMLERAGLGIAFHAKAKLKAAADTTLSGGGLHNILYFLGLTERDIQAFSR